MDPRPSHPPLPDSRRMLFAGLAFLLILACSGVTTNTQPTQTPFVITATAPPATATAAAEASPTASQPAATSTTAPSCTVLQQLNLRTGPGTAYNPPIVALETGTQFVPIGFNPVGVPGGSWVQARLDSINKTGWVSAGEQFVTCNLELSSLPEVTVAPPPKPAAPRVSMGAVDGNNLEIFRFSIDTNNDYFVRMYVFRSDNPDEGFSLSKDGRGIDTVKFLVTSSDNSRNFFSSTEGQAGYCIFGGGTPECNPWVIENGQYVWGAGGEPVAEQDYELFIEVTADDGEVGNWTIPITVRFP